MPNLTMKAAKEVFVDWKFCPESNCKLCKAIKFFLSLADKIEVTKIKGYIRCIDFSKFENAMMSKGKLCEEIAQAIVNYLTEGKKCLTSGQT